MNGAVVVAEKHLKRFLRTPLELIASLGAPLLWLLLFGLLLDSALARGGLGSGGAEEGAYLSFLLPGVVALTAWSAALFGGTTFYLEKDRGLILQYLAAPIRRSSYYLGLAGSAAVKTMLQVLLILALGRALGVVVPPAGALVAVAAAGLFAIGVYGLSVALAARSPTFESYHGVILLLQIPLFFLSDALYPLDSMPAALRWVAIANPLTHFIGLTRTLLGGGEPGLGVGVHLAVLGAVLVLGFAAGARAVSRWEPT